MKNQNKLLVILMIPLFILGGTLSGDLGVAGQFCYIISLVVVSASYVIDLYVQRTEKRRVRRTYKYIKLRNYLLEMMRRGYGIKKCLACVYDLYQEGLISEDEEAELYDAVDPKRRYNCVADYWYDFNEINPLMECLGIKEVAA